ncbi:MAG: hypothetical protein E6J71_26910 [Deltaproteobacteria bacterium]|nr:MAG: hypothetical protein E6J71_26910 [Deltaproteobacteria bacterium]
MYLPGDYAYLADLPTPLLCRVHEAETMPLAQGRCQLLRLVPLAGPWPAGTILIRLDHCVRPVGVRNHRPAGTPDAESRDALHGRPHTAAHEAAT